MLSMIRAITFLDKHLRRLLGSGVNDLAYQIHSYRRAHVISIDEVLGIRDCPGGSIETEGSNAPNLSIR